MSGTILNDKRRTMAALLTAALLGLPACGSDGATGPAKGGKVTGTYVLEAVDNEELPSAIHRGAFLDPETGIFYNSFVFDVEQGYIEIRENETFFISFDWRITADGQVLTGTNEGEGFWDDLPDGVRLRFQFPFFGTATLEHRDDGSGLHTDMDLGFGEQVHLDYDLFKR